MATFEIQYEQTWVRRPANFRETTDLPPAGIHHGQLLIRRQRVPNPPQFDGTLTPAGERVVFLRRLGDEHFLEKTKSDATGYFAFRGTYDERVQYEFCVIDNDGSVSRIFHIDNPAYSRYLGNPDVTDGTGISRGDP